MHVLVHTRSTESMAVSRAKKEEIARVNKDDAPVIAEAGKLRTTWVTGKADADADRRASLLECTGRNHGNQRHLISWRHSDRHASSYVKGAT